MTQAHLFVAIVSMLLSGLWGASFAPSAVAADKISHMTISSMTTTDDPQIVELATESALPNGTLILLKKDGKKIAAYKSIGSSSGNSTRAKLYKSYESTVPPGPFNATLVLPAAPESDDLDLPVPEARPETRQEVRSGNSRSSRSSSNSSRAKVGIGGDFFMTRPFTGLGDSLTSASSYWSYGALLGYQANPWFRLNVGAGISSALLTIIPTIRLGGTINLMSSDLSPTIGVNADYIFYSESTTDSSVSAQQMRIGLPIGIDYQAAGGLHISLNFYPIYWLYSSFSYSYTSAGTTTATSASGQRVNAFMNVPVFFQIGFFPSSGRGRSSSY